MKKLLLYAVVISAGLVAVQWPLAVHAASTIKGKITNHGAPVKNKPVNITVDGVPLPGPTPTTDDQGNYTATGDIPVGSTIDIKVDENGDGTPDIQGGVNDYQGGDITVNIHINPVQVPEYDWLGGMAAVGAGLGFIAWQRHRQSTALRHQV